jgi:PAS domain S-box-containing protein
MTNLGGNIFTRKITVAVMRDEIRVLHVEDDAQFADLTATYLKRIDDQITVEAEHIVSDGLERLSTEDFDCIISDYDMPGQNGIEFLETVRDEWPDIPFILFTGKGSEAVASEAISKGVTDYLQKAPGSDKFELLANRVRNSVCKNRAEQEAELWANAVETANEGISIIDETGRYIKMNRAYAALYGVEPGELIGEPWVTTVPEPEVERLHEDVFPMEAGDSWADESIGQRVDGSTYPELLSLATLENGGHVCVIRDITEQKEQERELQERAAKLDVLFEDSPDLINLHDDDGQLIDVNQRLCDALGYTEEEVLDKYVWDIDQTVEEDEVRRVWAEMDAGEMRGLTGEYQRADGTTFPVEVHLAKVSIDDSTEFFVIAREIGGKS